MELRYKDKVLGGGSGGGTPAVSGVPTGAMMTWLGSIAPDGWAVCDGALYQMADYPELANVIEQQFGSKNYFGGDGTTTFAVPDMRGRFMMGASEGHPIGETGGEEKVTLTVEQMPSHNHNLSVLTSSSTLALNSIAGGTYSVHKNWSSTNKTTTHTGDSQPHNNLPPFMALNYIIKL